MEDRADKDGSNEEVECPLYCQAASTPDHQAKKEKKEKVEQQQTLCLESVSASVGGIPKNNAIKRAFSKLWNMYKKPLKNYVMAKKKQENAIYCTPSLSFQLNGQDDQDLVPWGSWTKCPMNCPSCFHALMLL